MTGVGRMRAALAGAALCIAGAACADVAAIPSQNADALTLVDTDTLAVIATLPLPGKPAAAVVDGKRGRVLVVATETARLHVFDLTGQPLADWPVKGSPFAVEVRPETGLALVSDITGWLREIDPATGAELRRWATGAMPSGIAARPGLIAVANRDDDSVTLIEGERRREVKVGRHPFGITLHGGRAFVTDVLSDRVSVIDLTTAQVIATIPTGERPYALAFAAGKGFVTNQYAASLTVFDAETLAPLAEIETGDYPEGIAATADERRIFVANWFSDSLQVIDPETLEVTHTLDMPAGPRAFGSFIGQP